LSTISQNIQVKLAETLSEGKIVVMEG
jgi:hypothetical protein